MDSPERQQLPLSKRIIRSVAGTLIVIGLLFVLAGLLVPALGGHRHPPFPLAKKDIADIELAIIAFKANYDSLPMTSEASAKDKADFTYGTFGVTSESPVQVINPRPSYQANNAEIVTILAARNHPRFNKNHANNPQKKEYLSPKIATKDGKPGLGPGDGVYRDQWGNPYIISVDADGDGWTRDAFYSLAAVSRGQGKGINGLQSISGTGANDFALRGEVMVWSFGPDGKADPYIRANEGVNRDNILSWR